MRNLYAEPTNTMSQKGNEQQILLDELRRSEEKFRGIVENIAVGIIVLDLDWNITFINPQAADLLHRLGENLIGKNIWKEFPDSIGKKFYHGYKEALLTQRTLYIEDYSLIMDRWIKAAVYPSPSGLSIYFHDITMQKQAESFARESENKYRQLVERITDGFIALDKNFCYTYVNNKIGEMVHREPESLIGKNVWKEFPEAVGSATYNAFVEAWREQHYVNNIDYFEPLDLWQENHIYPSPEGLSIFVRDISEKMRTEEEKRKLHEKLHEKEKLQQLQLIETTLQAQEQERTYIGQELHDNVNQIVVATNLMLALIRDNPAKTSALIKRCIHNLEKVIHENRKLAHELVTPDLKKQTLVDQLNDFIKPMLRAKGIKVNIEVSNFREKKLNEKQKLCVYRIVQEQCTNISKYAKASSVTLKLATQDDQFELLVIDNGKGSTLSTTTKGIGLKNIEGRIRMFNGSMHIYTSPGNGFQLKVTMPVNEAMDRVE